VHPLPGEKLQLHKDLRIMTGILSLSPFFFLFSLFSRHEMGFFLSAARDVKSECLQEEYFRIPQIAVGGGSKSPKHAIPAEQ